jgi:hypothetical protein
MDFILVLLSYKNIRAVGFQFVGLNRSKNLARHHKTKAKNIFDVISLVIQQRVQAPKQSKTIDMSNNAL